MEFLDKEQEKKLWVKNRCRIYIYFIVVLIAIAMIIISFNICSEWVDVFIGVGSGLLTSLAVSIALTYENNKRARRKMIRDRALIFKSLIDSTVDIYINLIKNANEFSVLFFKEDLDIIELYDKERYKNVYFEFLDRVKKIEICKCNEAELIRIKQLLNINDYYVDRYISEIKKIDKDQLYIIGMLNKKEYETLFNETVKNKLVEKYNQKDNFKNTSITINKDIVIYNKLICYVSITIINALDLQKKYIISKEEDIKNNIQYLYYDEVYSKTEESIEQELSKNRYYNNYTVVPESEPKTEQDKLLEDIYLCITGWSSDELGDLLRKNDRFHKDTKLLFLQNDIQKELRKNRKNRRIIASIYGKHYLKEIKREAKYKRKNKR